MWRRTDPVPGLCNTHWGCYCACTLDLDWPLSVMWHIITISLLSDGDANLLRLWEQLIFEKMFKLQQKWQHIKGFFLFDLLFHIKHVAELIPTWRQVGIQEFYSLSSRLICWWERQSKIGKARQEANHKHDKHQPYHRIKLKMCMQK